MSRHAALAVLVLAVLSVTSATEATAATEVFETVDEYFEGLADRFDPRAARRTSAVIQWKIAGTHGGAWYAMVDRGTLQVFEGVYGEPELTISVGADDWVDILNGDASGKVIFASGRGHVDGSLLLAMKLERIFPLER